MQYSFDNVDTTLVKPEQFPAVRDKLERGEPGTYKIQGTMPLQLGLTREQREKLHREISGKGYTYQEALIEAKSIFGK